ncbi:uncharacterized protein ARMOST_07725 [Armillaria ostoyae]|uniref:Uncharacterized protein n=1 Tax=Armillaria ostoyae TaxID=47428 RepID=A0A284R6Q2_ARMOS|nr:uncharacterized protein ARMOST_07725 [Armillaria ostoyae]
MSSSIEYRHSVTPEPYEPAPMPPELTFEEYEVLVSEQASTEENYLAAMGTHEEWKVEKVKEARLEKLKVDREAWAEKLKVLQKKEEEWKAEEKRQADEKEHLWSADLQQKADATAKKQQDELQKKKEKEEKKAAKKQRKEQKKVEKAMKSRKGKGVVAAVELLREERGMDVDTEGGGRSPWPQQEGEDRGFGACGG